MADKQIVWNPGITQGDYAITDGDMAYENDLETSVIISLFSNRRLTDDVDLPLGSYRGGWWGDAYSDYPIGSRLWTLYRAKKVDDEQLLNRAEDYCNEALAWMLAIGVASGIDVNAYWLEPNVMGLTVLIAEPTQPMTRRFDYKWSWDGLQVPTLNLNSNVGGQVLSQVYVPPPTSNTDKLGGGFIMGQSQLHPNDNVGDPEPLARFTPARNVLHSAATSGAIFGRSSCRAVSQ